MNKQKRDIKRKTNIPKNEQYILVDWDFVFTKDNVVYGIYFKFPDGSLLKNYDDIQESIFPIGEGIKNNIQIQINQQKNEKKEYNKKMHNKLLEINRLNEKLKNNEHPNENYNFTELKNQLDELKRNAMALNSKNNNIKTRDNINYYSSQNQNNEQIRNVNIKNKYLSNMAGTQKVISKDVPGRELGYQNIMKNNYVRDNSENVYSYNKKYEEKKIEEIQKVGNKNKELIIDNKKIYSQNLNNEEKKIDNTDNTQNVKQ